MQVSVPALLDYVRTLQLKRALSMHCGEVSYCPGLFAENSLETQRD